MNMVYDSIDEEERKSGGGGGDKLDNLLVRCKVGRRAQHLPSMVQI